jgi:hypothetical protein
MAQHKRKRVACAAIIFSALFLMSAEARLLGERSQVGNAWVALPHPGHYPMLNCPLLLVLQATREHCCNMTLHKVTPQDPLKEAMQEDQARSAPTQVEGPPLP